MEARNLWVYQSLPLGQDRWPQMQDEVLELFKPWKCKSLVVGMCFDTTAANTCRINGTFTILEKAIGRKLLWVACQHHMFEILLSDAFTVCFGPSTGSEILFFKRLRAKWSDLNHHVPEPKAVALSPAREKLKQFIEEQLKLAHPRDDYLEFLQLAYWLE